MKYTPEQQLAMYRAGQYQMPAPPVFTGNWDEACWIKFIDRDGQWLPNAKALPPAPFVPRMMLRS